MISVIRKYYLFLLFGLFGWGMNACVVVRTPPRQGTRIVIIQRHPGHPRHPHGGPPGQKKKSSRHPGKRHY